MVELKVGRETGSGPCKADIDVSVAMGTCNSVHGSRFFWSVAIPATAAFVDHLAEVVVGISCGGVIELILDARSPGTGVPT